MDGDRQAGGDTAGVKWHLLAQLPSCHPSMKRHTRPFQGPGDIVREITRPETKSMKVHELAAACANPSSLRIP
jgi:hypothetical protein